MLIPSLYATSPRARSLRPIRVSSDQNIRWRLLFSLSTDKRQEIIVFFISRVPNPREDTSRDVAHVRHWYWWKLRGKGKELLGLFVFLYFWSEWGPVIVVVLGFRGGRCGGTQRVSFFVWRLTGGIPWCENSYLCWELGQIKRAHDDFYYSGGCWLFWVEWWANIGRRLGFVGFRLRKIRRRLL